MKQYLKKALGLGLSLAVAVSVTACSGGASGQLTDAMKKDGAFLTVGDQAISYDQFRYYFLNVKAEMEQSAAAGSASSNTSSTGATNLDLPTILTQTEDYLRRDYALNSWAKEQGVELTDDDISIIEQYISVQQAQMGGETAFNEWIETKYATPALFRTMMEESYLEDKAMNEWFVKNYGDQVIESVESGDTPYVHVKHILIMFDDDTEGADHSAEKAKAEEALNKALAGEDFDQLIEQYNEDPGMASNPDGYVFTNNGQMDKAFEEASFALDENSISTELVESSFGYHIIQRLPLDLEAMRAAAMNYASDEIVSEANQKLSSELEAASEKLEVKQGPEYKNLTVNIFDSTLPAPTSMPSTSSEAAGSNSASQPASQSSGSSASGEG